MLNKEFEGKLKEEYLKETGIKNLKVVWSKKFFIYYVEASIKNLPVDVRLGQRYRVKTVFET